MQGGGEPCRVKMSTVCKLTWFASIHVDCCLDLFKYSNNITTIIIVQSLDGTLLSIDIHYYQPMDEN